MGGEAVKSPLGAVLDRVSSALTRPRNQAPTYVSPRSSGGLSSAFGSRGAGSREAQLAAMGSVGTLFSIINRLSVDTAAVAWHMHRQASGGTRSSTTCEVCDQPGVTNVLDHPALTVWNRPNSFYTRQELVESTQQHIDLTGEGWWLVSKMVGRPVELWPIRPDRIVPVPHPRDFLSGYIYLGPDGDKVPLKLDEVIQIRMPNPLDPYRGMGPVQSILVDLDSSRYSAEWNRNFFLNGAEPGGIIELPTTLDDPEFETLRLRWNEQHKGVANAHRVALLELGKWVDRKFTQRDMQFAELRNVAREVIREAFGLHGHMLGMSETVNRANADAAGVDYARYQTVPRLDRIKQALNYNLLPMFGDSMAKGYELVPANPVPEDAAAVNAERDSKTAAYKTLTDAGVEPDDAAMVCGLPPMRHRTPAQQPQPVPAGRGVGASWRPRP